MVVLVSLAVGVALFASSGLVAGNSIDIGVNYDGESIEDGEVIKVNETEFEVNFSVESEVQINSVYASLHNETVARGVGGETKSYSTTHILTTKLGPNVYTVTVKDIEGNTESYWVDFYREPVTVPEMQEAVVRLQNEKERIEEEIDELKEKRDKLKGEKDDILASLNETEKDGSEDSLPVAVEGLPGFTALGALVAFLAVVGLVVRRRR